MIYQKIEDILINYEKIIPNTNGDVLHFIKNNSDGYNEFGEVYFSEVIPESIKGWKRHRKMIMNLIVPLGSIRFILFDERIESASFGNYQEIILSRSNYCRITIPPMIWFAFENIGVNKALIINFASIPHDPKEVDIAELNKYSLR